ncbi:MFS transporter [Levilactobacillus acidifarinae]|uniref:MFS transporter n=1 Tax=Levilactobacillus acidifarinae TaxID=267364 RepID=UPI0027D95865|nr:MFS transporter [Levilactobacillus acidifarinae]
MLIFSISSLLVGLATNGAMIIAMRAIQGIGSSILAPSTLALLMDNYDGTMRTKAIAYYGATGGLGASFGLVVGGIITSYFSWRWGFFLNFPIGLAMFCLSLKFLRSEKTTAAKIDGLGTLLSVIGLSSLVYSIDGTVYRLPALIVAVVALIGFVFQEYRAQEPLMPLALFKDAQRSYAYLARFAYLGFGMAYFFLTPLAMQHVYGFSPLQAAIGFLPETLPQFVMATVLTRLALRVSNSKLLMSGMILTFVGVGITALVGIQSGYVVAIALPMVIIGIGQGLVLSPLTVAGVANTTPKMSGSASGVVNTVHQIGGSVGLSIVVALTSQYTAPVAAYDHAVLWILALLLLAIIFSLGVLKATKGETH